MPHRIGLAKPLGGPCRYLPPSVQSPLGYLYRELVLPHPPSSRRSQVVPLVGFEPTRREGTAFEAADYTIRLQGLGVPPSGGERKHRSEEVLIC